MNTIALLAGGASLALTALAAAVLAEYPQKPAPFTLPCGRPRIWKLC